MSKRERFGRAEALGLAHELRTPLTSLALATGMLEHEQVGALNDRQREVVGAMTRDLERLKLLVERALRIDRLGVYAGPMDRLDLDLAELVDRVLAPLRVQASTTGVRLVEHLPHGARVRGDAAKLGWAAASLVGSALRFSPGQARVEVRVTARGERCLLRVADAGPGVVPERRRAIFGREGGGTLFIVREIVDAHGGELRLWSRPGRGSTFTVTLPRVHSDPEQPA